MTASSLHSSLSSTLTTTTTTTSRSESDRNLCGAINLFFSVCCRSLPVCTLKNCYTNLLFIFLDLKNSEMLKLKKKTQILQEILIFFPCSFPSLEVNWDCQKYPHPTDSLFFAGNYRSLPVGTRDTAEPLPTQTHTFLGANCRDRIVNGMRR